MDCAAARDEMLVVDLEELRSEADSPLADHLRSCSACRARASALLGGHAALERGLAKLQPADRIKPSLRARPWYWLPVPLAAAAALALLLVNQQTNETLPNVDGIARVMFRERPVVAPAAGQQAMVIEKNDLTIVWLYQEERL
jgi:hypothetical protein